MQQNPAIVRDIKTAFSIEKGNGLDQPWFRGHFNHNGFHYKISLKGAPMPNIFNGLMEIENLEQRFAAINSKKALAYLIIQSFGEATNITRDKFKKASFKVQIKTYKEQEPFKP